MTPVLRKKRELAILPQLPFFMRHLPHLLLLLALAACRSASETPPHRFPAEWEPHAAVWLGWHETARRDSVLAEMIRALYPHVPVKVLYRTDSMRRAGNAFLDQLGVDTARVGWVKNPHYSFWMRDPGPLFLETATGGMRVANFRWSEYGMPAVPEDLGQAGADSLHGYGDDDLARHLGLPLVSSPFVAEGGGLETNGRGLLMTIEETARQRNAGKLLADIEREYNRLMGTKKVVWLKRMTHHDRVVVGPSVENYFAGGANGHVDEVARFVGPNTVLVGEIDEAERRNNPIARLDGPILDEYAATLRAATDAEGTPLKVIRVPSPDLEPFVRRVVVNDSTRRKHFIRGLKTGDTAKFVPAVSYLNFLVTNGVVLIPKYFKPGLPVALREKDERVRQLFAELFPDRKTVQIDALPVNWGGGGMHCVSQQEPDGKPNF